MLNAHQHDLLSLDAKALQVVIQHLTGYQCFRLLPDITATGLNQPQLTIRCALLQVFAHFLTVQPFLPAVALIYALPQHLGHITQLCHLALGIQTLLYLLELSQCVVLVHRELRTYVSSAHASLRVILGVLNIVAVVTLDVAAVRTNLSRQLAGYLRIKERGVQVCTYLTYDEARPYIIQTYFVQTFLESLQERVEGLLVCQTAVHFLCTYLVADRSNVVCFAEILGVLDQLNRTFNHYVNVDDLALREEDIYSRVNVNQVVTCQDSCLVALLYAVHGALGVPTLNALFVLQPRTTVIDSYYVRTRVVHGCCLAGQDLREHLLRHAGITAIAVYLVQGRRKIDRRVVTFRCAERCLDYRQGVRARCKQCHRNSGCFFSLLHYAEDVLSLCHNITVQ